MCGLAGELVFNDGPADAGLVRLMTEALLHRGPDDSGIYAEGSIAIGHRRLSIIDLSESGRQPMWSASGRMCIAFNGEVYNYQEIRAALTREGCTFKSQTDTEVVLNAVERWGMDRAVSKFIGMFAFAVWDREERKLWLCRDRAGVKPLYYSLLPDRILFGSELKAILAHPRRRMDLDRGALAQHFCFGRMLGQFTPFQGTLRLMPGHFMTIDQNGRIRTKEYWSLGRIERAPFRGTFEEAGERLLELLESAFSYRLIADVPVALFLSGGVDSSILAAVLRKRLEKDVVSISIGFSDKSHDEVPKAKTVVQALGGGRHVVHVVDTTEAQEALSRFCEIYDEPFGDTSGIPTYLLARRAREEFKVALSADGGDEQFCGYEAYATYSAAYKILSASPRSKRALLPLTRASPSKALLAALAGMHPSSPQAPRSPRYKYERLAKLVAAEDLRELVVLMNQKGFVPAEMRDLLGVAEEDVLRDSPFENVPRSAKGDAVIDAMMRSDFAVFLGDDVLTKVDRASMFVSLECRDPMLDHRITEFAFSLPLSYLKGREQKRILRHLGRRWLPEEIISAPKQGFMIPLAAWMRGPWRPFVMDYLSEERVRRVGILDPKTVVREVRAFYASEDPPAERIWALLNFEMWAERWYRG